MLSNEAYICKVKSSVVEHCPPYGSLAMNYCTSAGGIEMRDASEGRSSRVNQGHNRSNSSVAWSLSGHRDRQVFESAVVHSLHTSGPRAAPTSPFGHGHGHGHSRTLLDGNKYT